LPSEGRECPRALPPSYKRSTQASPQGSQAPGSISIQEATQQANPLSADLFVMPNIPVPGDMEGFGIACLEATRGGLQVAAAALEGMADAVREGETGRFFESQNPQDCARVIGEMLQSPLDSQMVKRKTLLHYGWPHIFKLYEKNVFQQKKECTGIVTWDADPPKGGLGRAMKEIAGALPESVTLSPRSSRLLRLTKSFGGHLLFSLFLPFTLQRWIDRKGITTLLLPVGPGGIYLLKKPRRCRVVAISYHTYVQQSRLVPGQGWKRVFLPLERRTLKGAQSILCYSQDTKRVLLKDYGLSEERVKLLPQLLDVDFWLPKKEDAHVRKKERGLCVCVSRLEKRKGVEVLLTAWKDVERMVPEARLVIVGKGILGHRVNRKIQKLKTVRRVSELSPSDLRALVQKAEIIICPSYLEGFGRVATEAWLSGTAVVASDVDGLRSTLRNSEAGTLVPSGDPTSLGKAIVSSLCDPQTRESSVLRSGKDLAKRLDQKKAKEDLQEVLASLVSS